MTLDKPTFKEITNVVIDKLEGGYYNPAWHNTGDSRYGASGETMFGIDRKAGGAINTTEAGKKFWAAIDKNKSKDVWKWNYKGGTLNPLLKDMATDVIYPTYVKYHDMYLTPEAQAIVDADGRLTFHFVYATWNGPGWFKKFASDINKAVASGTTDPDKLVQVALDSRTKEGLKEGSAPNSLIKQGGEKIDKFIQSLDVYSKKKSSRELTTLLMLVLGVGAVYLIVKTIKKKK
jgi:hypothetical protein